MRYLTAEAGIRQFLDIGTGLPTSSPSGKTAYIDADLRNPGAILGAKQLTATLDLDQPVAVLLIAVLHLVSDDAVAYPTIETILNAVPSGSYLVISHATGDFWPRSGSTQQTPPTRRTTLISASAATPRCPDSSPGCTW